MWMRDSHVVLTLCVCAHPSHSEFLESSDLWMPYCFFYARLENTLCSSEECIWLQGTKHLASGLGQGVSKRMHKKTQSHSNSSLLASRIRVSWFSFSVHFHACNPMQNTSRTFELPICLPSVREHPGSMSKQQSYFRDLQLLSR